MNVEEARAAAIDHASKVDADIIFYTGPIGRPFDAQFIDLCKKNKRRPHAILFLCSQGGDPGAAYRIARCLQRSYDTLTVVIGGWCKSAGTLLTIGANTLVMADHAELGPLDVQIGKKDELWESDSGLTVLTAIAKLEEKCFELFESSFIKLKSKSGGRITLKMATELAHKLALGTVTPIISQIDPMHVGEVTRAMNIGLEYANRLAEKSDNVFRSSDPDEDAIQRLANGYPTHGFVIDREEASGLFINVREPSAEEILILEKLASPSRTPLTAEPFVTYLSEIIEKRHVSDSNRQGNDQAGPPTGSPRAAGTDEAGQESDVSQQRPVPVRSAGT